MSNRENSSTKYFATTPKRCPFCNKLTDAVIDKDLIQYALTPTKIEKVNILSGIPSEVAIGLFPSDSKPTNKIKVEFYICPYCQETSIKVHDFDSKRDFNIKPMSSIKLFFNNVPTDIYKDYSEARGTLNISPRASATLSRRCLQAMIHNRWNINLRNLNNEIKQIPSDKITTLEREALDAIRQIGNIGAHPNELVDVESEDANLLIQIIELFLQKWYIDDPAQENLLTNAIKIKQNKEKAKKRV